MDFCHDWGKCHIWNVSAEQLHLVDKLEQEHDHAASHFNREDPSLGQEVYQQDTAGFTVHLIKLK